MKYVLLILLTFYFKSLYSQKQKLLFSVEDNSINQKDFVAKNNLEKIYFFYQPEFAPNNSFKKSLFISNIISKIPDKNQNGFAIIDWEAEGFSELTNQTSKKYKNYILQYLEVLKIAKSIRPNVKWAFYGFPIRSFWKTDSNWRQRSLNLSKLYSAQDFIAPSIYLFYLKREVTEKNQINYLESNTKLALEIGNKYKKPVYPVVWQRIHNSNVNSGHKNIDIEYFDFYISTILKQSLNDKTVDGLIWWQAEEYQFKKFNQQKNMSKEYRDVRSEITHQNEVFKTYLHRFNLLMN